MHGKRNNGWLESYHSIMCSSGSGGSSGNSGSSGNNGIDKRCNAKFH